MVENAFKIDIKNEQILYPISSKGKGQKKSL